MGLSLVVLVVFVGEVKSESAPVHIPWSFSYAATAQEGLRSRRESDVHCSSFWCESVRAIVASLALLLCWTASCAFRLPRLVDDQSAVGGMIDECP